MTAPEKHPLSDGYPPSWAHAWGQDRYGIWVEVEVGSVRQRLRWIPGGVFWMGSPVNEDWRYDTDWPIHQVSLRTGFWLADSPCTQEFWCQLSAKNPSEFVSAERPVERISWHSCLEFLTVLNSRVPGLKAGLPTEAEWERACRAGTQGATWVGELDVVSRNHAPVLDAISWYSGNSGVDFDLEEGRDSSKWEAKQHNHRIAGTREVKRKKPNPWGLFDMLGNVSEWCLDTWIDSYDPGPRSDPLGSGEGPYKVVRGGAFDEDVYDQTAGRRFSYRPNDSTFYIGFRWAAKDD